MRYGKDLRKRAIAFVEQSGCRTEAAERHGITRRTLYNWLHAEDALPHEKPGPRKPRKIDWTGLKACVEAHPDLMLKEYAAQFNASINGIFHACKCMGLSYKKRHGATGKRSRT